MGGEVEIETFVQSGFKSEIFTFIVQQCSVLYDLLAPYWFLWYAFHQLYNPRILTLFYEIQIKSSL